MSCSRGPQRCGTSHQISSGSTCCSTTTTGDNLHETRRRSHRCWSDKITASRSSTAAPQWKPRHTASRSPLHCRGIVSVPGAPLRPPSSVFRRNGNVGGSSLCLAFLTAHPTSGETKSSWETSSRSGLGGIVVHRRPPSLVTYSTFSCFTHAWFVSTAAYVMNDPHRLNGRGLVCVHVSPLSCVA